VAERTISWLHGFRKLRLVTEKTQEMQFAFISLSPASASASSNAQIVSASKGTYGLIFWVLPVESVQTQDRYRLEEHSDN
jgi:hypothetical protein